MTVMGVADAAEQLGVSARRVRQLIQSGGLRAARVGRSWGVHADSVAARAHGAVVSGRPLQEGSVWRIALLADGNLERLDEISAAERWRARRALEDLLDEADLSVIEFKLRARCGRLEHLFAHPSVIDELARDDALILTGQRAAARFGSDLVPSQDLDAYVETAVLGKLGRRYGLRRVASENANVVLRVLDHPVPGSAGGVAPRLLVAADLLRSGDARSRIAAKKLIRALTSDL